MTTQTKTSRKFKYEQTIGRSSVTGESFRTPVDIALGKDGDIYVLNRTTEKQVKGHRVCRLNLKEEFLGDFGQRGEADGEFIWALSVAASPDGRVFVCDEWLNRITIFSREGKFLTKWGGKGSGDGQLHGPAGLAFDPDGNLLISDGENHRIQRFTPEGKFLSKWGRFGAGDGELNMPWGVTTDRQGNVFVADWRNDRIQKFTPDGKFLMKFGSSGAGEGQFNRPTGVAVDKDGDIYVTDWGNDRVQVFDKKGKFITLWTGDAGLSKWGMLQLQGNTQYIEQRAKVPDMAEKEKKFREPIAVEVDSENRIMIIDGRRDRIQIYRKVS
ncbi:MAG: hypothetical protein FJ320_09655 [SAR202 cluster bacterium]|nr:hypothetical protein [SAR202 cluster bacterium]